jgi:two-component system chemotaxis response regulator CheY
MTKSVLVVDDSPVVRQQVGMALGQCGFKVIEAEDGLDGLAKLAGNEVSAIISDINMPRMNGLEFAEKVHADARLAKLPMVMLTSEAQPQLIARAKLAGVKGWIIKPFKADLLVAAVNKLVA